MEVKERVDGFNMDDASLVGCESEGRCVEGIKEVKEGIRSHFKKAFSEPDFHKPTLEDVSFKVLSFEDNSKMEIPFSYMEVKTTVWDCEVSKSPGLDNYNLYFIRKCWDFLKVDIINLLDGVLVANEIIDLVTRSKKSYLLFKIDFEKAYDIESWNFIRFIMKKMRFGERWIKRIEANAFSSFLSILVNGNPTVDFEVAERKSIEVFQFVDETLILGEGDWKNIWSIKEI
ncbi:hypothetical protein KIW84_074797 [Lathyrus oleraceus]|uniref:Reverse transcriptase domain-containing protein n=1 Tax=Pisum sativum TaxID=3888 RepID=A0A9D4VS65_PEA|nr:hypothetical protein KIW84_074797 [Pisum sativum]